MSSNIDTVDTSTNATDTSMSMSAYTNMDTSIDMDTNNISVMMNSTAFQEPRSDPIPQVNGFLSLV